LYESEAKNSIKHNFLTQKIGLATIHATPAKHRLINGKVFFVFLIPSHEYCIVITVGKGSHGILWCHIPSKQQLSSINFLSSGQGTLSQFWVEPHLVAAPVLPK
jgi:hypothetical protein